MQFDLQLAGLNRLLSDLTGVETTLTALLSDQGFEQAQFERLQREHMQAVTAAFVEAIHGRLTGEWGQDTYFAILSRRYGLDGEPADSLEALASQHGQAVEFMRQQVADIVQRLKSRAAQTDLLKRLKYIAVAELSKANAAPTRDHVAAKLEQLVNLRGAADVARLDYEARRAQLLKNIQAELDALDIELKPILEAAEENLLALENEIKTDVLLHGESVQAGSMRAVYTRGRVTWDSKGIEQYSSSHPELLRFRKQGEPTVSLRVVND
jgi:hypothetical protein